MILSENDESIDKLLSENLGDVKQQPDFIVK